MNTSQNKNPQPVNQAEQQAQQQLLEARMRNIRQKILVLSGKGGVGKSTVAANLAVSLARSGKTVGLLDVDVHGPSIPKLVGLEGHKIGSDGKAMVPAQIYDNLKVMSIGFLLQSDSDAVIWRGPLKFQVIRQFLTDVAWGQLDYLVIDSPPGTGDEPLSVAQLVGSPAGAVIVTTPQDLAISDVRRCVSFCKTLSLPIIGIVENMSGLVCPQCGNKIDLFKRGGGRALAGEMNVPFLGQIPIDPQIVIAADAGKPLMEEFVQSETSKAFAQIIRPILGTNAQQKSVVQTANKANTNMENHRMKLAIPLSAGRLSMHFGHCDEFAIIEVDMQDKKIVDKVTLQPPAHEPGVLPQWLGQQGANLIIASGMGQRAQQLFNANGIDVIVGAPSEAPEVLAEAYLNGTLQTGQNICDH